MATLGYANTPTFGYESRQTSGNQAGQFYTMPAPGGIITSVSFYGSGDGSTHNTAYGCIWDTNGNLLAQGSGINTSGGSASAGGQAWHTDTLTSPLFVAGGTTILIGWQRSPSSYFDWSFAGDGATIHYHTSASGTPTNTGSIITLANGSIGAYITYTLAGVQVNTGTPGAPSWTTGLAYVNTGTPGSPTWTQASVFANTGTPGSPTWTQVG